MTTNTLTSTRTEGMRLPMALTTIMLGAIVLLAACLRFYNLDAIGDGNQYYTAAVESMLDSPSNFFFVAAEPGGSVTVDKPPLGLWLQTISAMIFGVNGFAVTLPQILAGILAVPLIYWLTRRYFGEVAGLLAAFILAVTPVAIAVERNNTMDATLIFTVLLAAWAFIKATDSSKLKYLLLGGLLIGLGFNIKMLQAFLPVPAFYALFFFGAKISWSRKIVYLTAATVVLTAVSFSWVVVVDLWPAEDRPYIGSSEDNSVMELIFGHNGLNRLTGGSGGQQPGGNTPPTGNFGPPQGQAADGQFGPPPDGPFGGPPPDGGNGAPSNGVGGSGEIGEPGLMRLFELPLANEISWLLPFGLFSIGLVTFSSRLRFPLNDNHQAVVLWGGWLTIGMVFFSVAGFYHVYYLAMLAPSLAAIVAMGVARLWQMAREYALMSTLLLTGAATLTISFQMWTVSQYDVSAWWLIPTVGLLAIGGIAIHNRTARTAGFALVVAALLVTPSIWAGLTTLDDSPHVALPHAYAGESNAPGGGNESGIDEQLVAYLQANTQDTKYLMAVPSSMIGANYVTETGRPVLYMGGFNGGDPVVDANDLAALVADGELRYALWGQTGGPGRGDNQAEIGQWLQSACNVVNDVDLNTRSGSSQSGPPRPGGQQQLTLYQCTG